MVSLSVCMAFAVTLQGFLIYSVSSNEITDNVTEIATEKLSSQMSSIDRYLLSLDYLAYGITTNDDIRNNLNVSTKVTFYDRLSIHNDGEEILRQLAFSYDYIAGVFILLEEDYPIMDRSNYTFRSVANIDDDLILDYIYGDSDFGYVPSVDAGLLMNTSSDNVFCYYSKIFAADKHVATTCIFVDKMFFDSVHANVEETRTDILISDESGALIYSSDVGVGQSSDSIILEDELANGWSIFNYVPSTEIDRSSTRILQYVLIGTVSAFMICFVFLNLISNYISKSLLKLNRKMAVVGVSPYTFDDRHLIREVSQLNDQFNEMEQRLTELMRQIREEQKEIDKAHVEILQAQINPHFLYNTLDAINWMAIERNADDISNMTSNLANLFRYGLNGGKESTIIENELAHLDAYLIIQKHRFNNRFTFNKEVDEEILHCNTLNIILQPIVENCFVHGFRDMKDHLNITLEVRQREDDIVFIVTDDGKGCDAGVLNKYLSDNTSGSGGYGTKNIHRRLALHFGKDYGVRYVERDSGTRVMINIPLSRNDETQEDT